jgi:hypothetical protein
MAWPTVETLCPFRSLTPVFSLETRSNFELMSVYKFILIVIPADAGIQNALKRLDSRFHGNDKKRRLQHLWTGIN